MHRTACAVWAAAVTLGGPLNDCLAQDEAAPPEDLSSQIQELRQRVSELERRHERDQERVRQLEEQLGGADSNAPAPPIEPPPAAPRGGMPELQPAGILGQGNLLNPQITAFFDLGGSYSTNEQNKAMRRFNLREAEVDLRAAVAPWADGVLILAIGEEIEEMPGGTIDVSTVFELEEGYLDFHSLPHDLTLKVGKFRNAFGRSNLLHTHDLPQITRPLAVQAFLGPEGLASIGGSLNWLVPNPWEKYIELTAEVVNADGGEESPILAGPNADNPAVIAHLKLFDDLGDFASMEIGGSYLFARTSDASAFDANVFGIDATLTWHDPEAPDSRSLLLQSELFWAQNDIESSPFGTFRNDSFGYYALGQVQLDQNWYAGVRFDSTEFPSVASRAPWDSDWAVSTYLTWYLTEFLRFRMEYQHREFEVSGIRDEEDNILFGITFSIGAHPAHPYWVNR